MTRSTSPKFLFQLNALLLVAILTHGFYIGVIRPEAYAIQEEHIRAIADDPNYAAPRSLYVILSGYEQETCFILLFWALTILSYKAHRVNSEFRFLHQKVLTVEEGKRIVPDMVELRPYIRQLTLLPKKKQDYFLPTLFKDTLQRFTVTKDIQATADFVKNRCQLQADELESDLSMIRYIAWAIPSIGFIGTVRGIGLALGEAHRAVEGDITGVTSGLGIAFDSTLIALFISIILMFCVHQVQRFQERFVLEVENYSYRNLISHLHVAR